MPYAWMRAGSALTVLLLLSVPADAQTTVTLPDTSQVTTVTVSIGEQATVTIPSMASFTVANVAAATLSSPAIVRVEDIVVGSSTSSLRLSLKANSPSFAPPVAGATTWLASDVSWSGIAWTGATGTNGTLNSASFTPLATCSKTGCSTSGLVFTLAPNPSVRRAGAHTLVVTWKIESM